MQSCNFDGGDCIDSSAYVNCFPNGSFKRNDCARLFNNSQCNMECNSSGCLYDGGDCQDGLVSFSVVHNFVILLTRDLLEKFLFWHQFKAFAFRL